MAEVLLRCATSIVPGVLGGVDKLGKEHFVHGCRSGKQGKAQRHHQFFQATGSTLVGRGWLQLRSLTHPGLKFDQQEQERAARAGLSL